MEQCTGFTRSGERCKKPGADGTDRCAYHRSRDDSEARLADEIRTLRDATAHREATRVAKSFYHERRALSLSDRDLIVLAHLLEPEIADVQWVRDLCGVGRQRVYRLKDKVRREVLRASGDAARRRSLEYAHALGASVPAASKAPPYEYVVLDAICEGAEDAVDAAT